MPKPLQWSELNEAIQANPNRFHKVGGGPATASITAKPDDTVVSWLPGWTEDSDTMLDIIALSLGIREPLYRIATDSTKAVMEMEEASYLLHQHEKAYKEFTSHTWTRKHLEEELRARAGGAPASPDFWKSVKTSKRIASLVDYVCRLRTFRLGLIYDDMITSIPLISSVDLTLIHNGHVLVPAMLPKASWPDVVIKSDLTWFIPPCVPSVGATTMSQIMERLKALKPGTYKGNRLTLWRLLQMELSYQ